MYKFTNSKFKHDPVNAWDGYLGEVEGVFISAVNVFLATLDNFTRPEGNPSDSLFSYSYPLQLVSFETDAEDYASIIEKLQMGASAISLEN